MRKVRKVYTYNKILASKVHLKQQKISAFAPLVLKRWITTKVPKYAIGSHVDIVLNN